MYNPPMGLLPLLLAAILWSLVARAQTCDAECRWLCDDPVCPAVCVPDCLPPVCARCLNHTLPDPPYYNLTCRPTQRCHVTCPPDQCNADMCPACETTCPTEGLCQNEPVDECIVLCEAPQCGWRCSKPLNCPKPRCELQCEEPACAVSGGVTTTNSPISISLSLLLPLLLTVIFY